MFGKRWGQLKTDDPTPNPGSSTVNPRYMNTQQECMKCRLETYFKMFDSGYAFSLACTKRKLLRCSQLQRVEYD